MIYTAYTADANKVFELTSSCEYPLRLGTTKSKGIDVPSPISWVIEPHSVVVISTGLRWTCYGDEAVSAELQVRSRSSMAAKGLIVANSPGTIDEDYKGDIGIIIANITNERKVISAGDYIAQLVFSVGPALLITAIEAAREERGEGGFGSTGT